MKSYIKSIIIFNEEGEKRTVNLKEGVNIITGESKTGKSALVEIIDYCFCSARCTIPKGKITEFSYLYSIVININELDYIIARYKWEVGGKMYFFKVKDDYNLEKLELSIYRKQPILQVKEAQSAIEKTIGLTIDNIASEFDTKGKKASMRNMVSYLFQHQNLMASKFSLFYRFSNYYKRKDAIEQFPIFAGMINQKYYSYLIELDSLKQKLKQKRKIQKDNEKSMLYSKSRLGSLLMNYFALIGKDFDDTMDLHTMFNIAKNLPDFDNNDLFADTKIIDHYNNLNEKLENLRNKDRDILLELDQIKKTNQIGENFNKTLKNLKEQNEAKLSGNIEYTCPICGNDCSKIVEKDIKLQRAVDWLNNEIKITGRYTEDFSEDYRKLNEAHLNFESEIKLINNQIKRIENKYIKSPTLKSKREKINYAKATIDLYLEMESQGIFENVEDDIDILNQRIDKLEQTIKKFNLEKKMKNAENFLNKNMNLLSKKLDFEEEYIPVNLNFDLVNKTFDLFQLQPNKERIYLYEMGSGANWVSCHIALFLSFLRYFSMQKNSPMLLTMFFDQPSQVYFPQEQTEKNLYTQSDLIAVNKMYKAIFDEVNSIKKDTGILPQIIIVDHVDGANLDCKDEFEKYVCSNWRKGDALI